MVAPVNKVARVSRVDDPIPLFAEDECPFCGDVMRNGRCARACAASRATKDDDDARRARVERLDDWPRGGTP